MICTVIRSKTLQEVHDQLKSSANFSSVIELHLDHLTSSNWDDLQRLRQAIPLPVIFTLKPKSQGGEYAGTEEERQSLIKKFASLHPDYFDLEFTLPSGFLKEFRAQNPAIKTILSFYDAEKMPSLSSTLENMRKIPADYYKMIVKVSSSFESLSLLQFMKTHGPNLSVIGLGERGIPIQILAPIFGGTFIYASRDEKNKTAAEQLSISELVDLYHVHQLTENSLIYGVIGNPLDKSLGPITYNPLFDFFNIPAVYVKFPVTPEEVKDFMTLAKKIGIKGLSVTMPLKEQVIPYLDEIDNWAKKIRSVNNLIIDGEKISSYNTDGKGALDAIESKMKVKKKKMVLLGAGGAGKAIAAAAVDRGADVTILDINEESAKKLAEILGCSSGSMAQMGEEYEKGYDILVNATPSPLPIDSKLIIPNTVVMDVSMKPLTTQLLEEAEKKGCLTANGGEMFINQALIQAEHWFGSKIDFKRAHEMMVNAVFGPSKGCEDEVDELMQAFGVKGKHINHYEKTNLNDIPSLLQPFFAKDCLLSVYLREAYHQDPEIDILEEKTVGNLYLRKELTEILTDHFSFQPMAFSYILIKKSDFPLINPEDLMPLEEALNNKNPHVLVKTHQMIKVKDWQEVSPYFTSELYGKLSCLLIDDKPIAKVLDFVSLHPNTKRETEIFDAISHQLLAHFDLNRDIENALQHVKGALEISPKEVINAYFPHLNREVKTQIEAMIDGVEHMALLVPYETNIDELETIASRVGFKDNHQIVPSVIVAKELGELAGKEKVSTLVFKAWGHNSHDKKIGLEVFIPQEKNSLEHDWIEHEISLHISLRVKNFEDISKIRKILGDRHIEMAKFLHGKLILDNEVYFDVFVKSKRMRIEFNYKKAS